MNDKVSIDIKDLNKLIDERNKYMQMWEELILDFKQKGCYTKFSIEVFNRLNWEELTLYIIEKIEQKYFPKTFKKTVTIELVTNKYDDIAFGIKTIGNIIDDISGNSGIPEMKIIDRKED
ncbi:MAG TPA: hypothetical protein VMW50_04675 [Dehalococcoidia bacterium]|nr:hypothetical protein [Dehalococcoidia bacterium]